MKKVLAVLLCVCIALTISVSVLAESSPQNTIIIRKGVGTKQDGSAIPQDTFTELSAGNTVTVNADEKTYGKFNSWTIYVVTDDGEYVEAEEGVDFEIVDGSLEDTSLTIKSLGESVLTIAGNYNDEITDPSGKEAGVAEVMVKKGAGEAAGEEMTEDEFVEVAVGSTVTVEPKSEYGEFDSWSIYVVSDATAATAGTAKIINLAQTQKTTAAKEGTDYKVVEGSLSSDDLSIEVLKEEKLIICGNYDGKITDPNEEAEDAGEEDTGDDKEADTDKEGETPKSSKTSDSSVVYAVFALLAAGAIVFGAKKQFSK